MGNHVEVRVLSSAPLLAAVLLWVGLSGVSPASADFQAGAAAYEQGDYESALREWTPLAEGGLVEAQFNLGLLHQNGRGVEQDLSAAHAWYLRAAEGGYARAQYRVAEMYEAGEGVRRDLIQAHLWFRIAGDRKYEDAKKRRKRVAERMTPEQIALADMQARHRRRDAKSED